MFVFTAKLTKKKLAGMIVAAGGVLVLVIALIASRGSAQAGKEFGAVKNIKSNADRVAYLQKMGWTVDEEPIVTEEVLIPVEWNDVFEDYNVIQNDQGFDLDDYKGKRVTRVAYSVKNHPSGKENVQANLLCYKNTIIAGDVQSPSLDGFMHGLSKEASSGLFTAPKPSAEPSPAVSPEASSGDGTGLHSPGPDCPKMPDGSDCNCEDDPENCACENCEH